MQHKTEPLYLCFEGKIYKTEIVRAFPKTVKECLSLAKIQSRINGTSEDEELSKLVNVGLAAKERAKVRAKLLYKLQKKGKK